MMFEASPKFETLICSILFVAKSSIHLRCVSPLSVYLVTVFGIFRCFSNLPENLVKLEPLFRSVRSGYRTLVFDVDFHFCYPFFLEFERFEEVLGFLIFFYIYLVIFLSESCYSMLSVI